MYLYKNSNCHENVIIHILVIIKNIASFADDTCFYRFTTMAVTGLSPGHQYEFRVYAENVYGRSDFSDTTGLVTTKSTGKKPVKKKQYEGNYCKRS